jgi:hypothetical protein
MYQCLSPRLQFNPTNFQHYVKAQQGTNFILLHFWFHTLIILLHQPTLLHSFEGRMQQLFPGSRELAMSSAKTIADIIAFAELIDVKSIVGNPFTSQPMYIAARAFLAEAAIHASQPVSRGSSPPTQEENGLTKKRNEINGRPKANKSGKSSLLHSAANTNYQRCYKALQILESYWAGCRYILTALDQMSTGLMDPLLFTSEDVEEMPSTAPSFTTPGWRRSTTHRASMGVRAESPTRRLQHWDEAKAAGILDSWSPGIESSQAIGWSVTGGVDTFAPNVSFLYQNLDGDTSSTHPSATTNTAQAARPSRYALDGWHPPQASQGPDQTMLPPILATDTPSTDADLLLSMSSEYVPKNSSHAFQQSQSQPYAQGHIAHIQTYNINNSLNFADLPFISHDVDMSISNNFAFPGVEDVIPWLEYLPQDVLDYFGEPHGNGNGPEPAGV